MIKGKYVALVEVDVHIPESKHNRPFEEIKDDVMNGWVTNALKEVIEGEVFDDKKYSTVKVTQQYADLYEVDGE